MISFCEAWGGQVGRKQSRPCLEQGSTGERKWEGSVHKRWRAEEAGEEGEVYNWQGVMEVKGQDDFCVLVRRSAGRRSLNAREFLQPGGFAPSFCFPPLIYISLCSCFAYILLRLHAPPSIHGTAI